MREMKDSGVEWIGEIPNNWKTIKFKYVVECENTRADNNQNYIGLENVESWTGRFVPGQNEAFEAEGGSLIVKKGDVLFGKLRPYLAKCAISELDGCCSTEFLVLRGSGLNNKYVQMLMTSPMFIEEVNMSTYGAKMPRASWNYIGNMRVPYPTDSQQQAIVEYLDSKCSKIDEIIEKQQKIIEKLKEYKLSVITEAVTKGLNPDVEMKDSGVEWLGSYPAHWSYLAFKNVLYERTEKNIPVQTEERLSLSIDKGVTLYAEKTTNLDRFKDDVSQYKLAHEGDLVMNSMNMIVGAIGVSDYFGCVSPAYYTYYDNESDHIKAKYCDFLMRCKTMRKVLYSMGKGIMSIDRGDDRINTCRLKVSRNDLRSLKIPVPPLEEQRKIVSYLVNKGTQIDKTILDRETAIQKLQEYKKSLIYEVVTGKKEV